MNHLKQSETEIPAKVELDDKIAQQMLDNIFRACDLTPNAIPLDTLTKWENYRKMKFGFGKVVSFIAVICLLLIPVFLLKPQAQIISIQAPNINVRSFDIEIDSVIPVEKVKVTLNGEPVPISKVNSKLYTLSVTENGTLVVSTTLITGQATKRSIKIDDIDLENPVMEKFYQEDNIVYIHVTDSGSGIDFGSVKARNVNGTVIPPLSYDEAEGILAFSVPEEMLTVMIPDKAENVLQIVLSSSHN